VDLTKLRDADLDAVVNLIFKKKNIQLQQGGNNNEK
jgi:hypothetical protein